MIVRYHTNIHRFTRSVPCLQITCVFAGFAGKLMEIAPRSRNIENRVFDDTRRLHSGTTAEAPRLSGIYRKRSFVSGRSSAQNV